jgi:2-haloacid dehalogenase
MFITFLAILMGIMQTVTVYSQRTCFKAVAFDYFVIFNADSVISEVEKVFPGKGREFTRTWRSKQFEYGFLLSTTDRHEDFLSVTGEALDFTAYVMHLSLTPETRSTLLNAYLTLKPWPDIVPALKKLKAAGVRIITIANFSEKMLRANAENAGIADLFDELLSTEVNNTYKPDPRAYELGLKHLHLKKEEIAFAAFGGWDAYGAKNFGYPTYWVNRFGQPTERNGEKADRTSGDIAGLLEFVLGKTVNEDGVLQVENIPALPSVPRFVTFVTGFPALASEDKSSGVL